MKDRWNILWMLFSACTDRLRSARSCPVSRCDGRDEEPGLHCLEPWNPEQQLSSSLQLGHPLTHEVVYINGIWKIYKCRQPQQHIFCSTDFPFNATAQILMRYAQHCYLPRRSCCSDMSKRCNKCPTIRADSHNCFYLLDANHFYWKLTFN